MEIENRLRELIQKSLEKLGKEKRLKVPPDTSIELDFPKDKKFGDYATNLAFNLGKTNQLSPEVTAGLIKDYLPLCPSLVENTSVVGGYLNFRISSRYFQNILKEILKVRDDFATSSIGQNKKTQVEFVSVNPTGPLTIGHGRQAALGDTIANIMEKVGYKIVREYYYNDAGRQMQVLGDSVRLRYKELLGEKVKFPEDYYQGEYIYDIARKLKKEHGDSLKSEEDGEIFKDTAEKEIFADIKKTLRRMGVKFDIFFNEKSLYEEGEIEKVVQTLREKGLAYDEEGAVWFRATAFGIEKDRVIIKSTGEPTYRLPDICYHKLKFERGFEWIIDIFGADHIATYPDVLAGIQALGYDTSKITVLIHQFVTLYKGKEKVKMSTRKANFVTLDELIDEVGKEATRYFFLNRKVGTHLNFDLELAKKKSLENPVYYVQYAHARICSIYKKMEEEKIKLPQDKAKYELLKDEKEIDLMRELAKFPSVIQKSAQTLEPHRLTNYLYQLATAFHYFYDHCKVLTEEENLAAARLHLCNATRTVLGEGLRLLGIKAALKM